MHAPLKDRKVQPNQSVVASGIKGRYYGRLFRDSLIVEEEVVYFVLYF